MAPKKKSKSKPTPEMLYENWKKGLEPHWALSRRLFDHQDTTTREAITVLQERIAAFAMRRLPFAANGKPQLVDVEQDVIDNNALVLAMELVRDAALTGIKIANFDFEPDYCARCGEPRVRAKKKKVVKKRGKSRV